MKKHIYIIEQINTAKEFIKMGDLAHVRMAFVLLDNAAEILMHRAVKPEMTQMDWYRRTVEEAKGYSKEKYKQWESGPGKFFLDKMINVKTQKKIERYFDEKVNFLLDKKSKISPSKAWAISQLHKYRNDLYHNDIVCEETISVFAKFYYELVCELYSNLSLSSYTYSSSDGDQIRRWFKKYGFGAKRFTGFDLIPLLIKKLKLSIRLKGSSLSAVLSKYLAERVEMIEGGIDFIGKDGLGIQSGELVLKYIQYPFKRKQPFSLDILKKDTSFVPTYRMKNILNIKSKVGKLLDMQDKLTIFKFFVEIEKELAPLEELVGAEVSALDGAIQHAIDVARGK